MKTQNTKTPIYTAPKIKTVTVSTRSKILQSSIINNYQDGNVIDNDGYGYDME